MNRRATWLTVFTFTGTLAWQGLVHGQATHPPEVLLKNAFAEAYQTDHYYENLLGSPNTDLSRLAKLDRIRATSQSPANPPNIPVHLDCLKATTAAWTLYRPGQFLMPATPRTSPQAVANQESENPLSSNHPANPCTVADRPGVVTGGCPTWRVQGITCKDCALGVWQG